MQTRSPASSVITISYEATARQTAELFRIRWGGGLYFNYVFTAVWAADVLWMWAKPEAYRARREEELRLAGLRALHGAGMLAQD